MFEVKITQNRWGAQVFKIVDDNHNYLHSDGTIYSCGEYWPTEEQAQTVLDNFQPKHVWKHGDVFDNGDGRYPKVYIHVEHKEPEVFHLSSGTALGGQGMPARGEAGIYTEWQAATFLFNIKDKL